MDEQQTTDDFLLSEWCTALWQYEGGEQFLKNLYMDIKKDCIDIDLVKEFLAKINAISQQKKNDSTPLQHVDEVLKFGSDKFLFQGNFNRISDTYCCILPLDIFVKRYIANTKELGFQGEGDGKPYYYYSERLINNALRKINKAPDKYISKPLQNNESYTVWVARDNQFNSAIEECNSHKPRKPIVGRLRDALGLSHFDEEGRQFVKMQVTKKQSALAPTSLDGGIHDCFRSKRHSRYKNWGTTVDLTHRNWGMPEAVRKPWKTVSSMRVTYLGELAGFNRIEKKELRKICSKNVNLNKIIDTLQSVYVR